MLLYFLLVGPQEVPLYSVCEVINADAFPAGWKAVAVVAYSGPDEVVYWRRNRTRAFMCAKINLDDLARTGMVETSMEEEITPVALNDFSVVVDSNLQHLSGRELYFEKCKNFGLRMLLIKRNLHVRVCCLLSLSLWAVYMWL